MEALAKLNNLRISPRKVREVVDLVRGRRVDESISILRYTNKKSSEYISKLIRSALSNWEMKNSEKSIENTPVFIKTIKVDCASTLKRLMTAPQGRGYRIRKRSSHVTVVVDEVANAIN